MSLGEIRSFFMIMRLLRCRNRRHSFLSNYAKMLSAVTADMTWLTANKQQIVFILYSLQQPLCIIYEERENISGLPI